MRALSIRSDLADRRPRRCHPDRFAPISRPAGPDIAIKIDSFRSLGLPVRESAPDLLLQASDCFDSNAWAPTELVAPVPDFPAT